MLVHATGAQPSRPLLPAPASHPNGRRQAKGDGSPSDAPRVWHSR